MAKVSIVKYEKPFDSVIKAITLSDAFKCLTAADKVFIKPNIVTYSRNGSLPPFGVITTSKVVEDVVKYLANAGVKNIVIGEGTITSDPKDTEITSYAFEKLGYHKLVQKYGVKLVNVFETDFQEVDLGDDVKIKFSKELLSADFLVSLPVLKTHAQTKVSLGIKNLKGCIDIPSRKLCHSNNFIHDLDFHIAKITKLASKSCTIIDGIYSLERGPMHTGTAKRTNLIIASSNMLAADIVGASVLGINPIEIPYLKQACNHNAIEPNVDSFEVVGESIQDVVVPHKWEFEYNKENTNPRIFDLMRFKGIYFPKYDHSLCSYCFDVIGLIQYLILKNGRKHEFDNVELLTGKIKEPSKGMNHTILVGICQSKLNKDHHNIINPILVPGCPPKPKLLIQALNKAGIKINKETIDEYNFAFADKYTNKKDFSLKDYWIA